MTRLPLTFVRVICTALLALPVFAQPRSSGYHLLDSLRLGGEGGWDYLAVDTTTQRLFVSRGSHVQVIDPVKNMVVGDIAPTPGVHGVAFNPALGRGYTSNGRDSSVTVFDLASFKVLTTIKIDGRNPDAILFDPFSFRVFTFNGGSANATALDARSDMIVGTVALPGKPEFAVSDHRGKIYVNIEDKNELVVFDARTLKVLGRWPLAPGKEPSGLAIDREGRRLFAGCSNRLMVVVDADSGRIVTTLPIGGGVDATAFDPFTRLAFSSNGEGTMTVVSADGSEKYSLLDNVVTRRGARTMTIDGRTHRAYTVSARFGPPPPATAERPRPRPMIEPGSVTLYILDR